ncbi:MAG TPA: hypothetical protein VIO11_11145 [Candidatus Methanoperedens sp.]
MVASDDFVKYCFQTLNIYFGQLSEGIIDRVRSRKSLDRNSNISDFEEFIDLIEANIGLLSGKGKARDICDILRTRALAISEINNIMRTSVNSEVDKEIKIFLAKNPRPDDADITDYAKHISTKYGGIAGEFEKHFIEKTRLYARDNLSGKIIKEEIDRFLTRFPQPMRTDVDDFINYIRLLKLVFREDELRESIEKERLFRKFHEAQKVMDAQDASLRKKQPDKKNIGKSMQKSQAVTNENDEVLKDFKKLATPSEKDVRDALEGLGLKHMIRKK